MIDFKYYGKTQLQDSNLVELATLANPLRVDPTGTTQQPVVIQDGTGRQVATDAFERLRVSEPFSVFDSKQIYDDNPLFFDTDVTAGGTVTHNINKASSELKTTTASGDIAIRQSKRYFNYQPGKSMQMFLTYNFEAEDTNVEKRVGYFDADDGIFLQLAGTALSLNRRSNVTGSPVDESVAQASWNIDKLDGTGISGLTLDNTKVQILVIDFQWLGVGTVRIGFDIDGKAVIAHEFKHANTITSVYMQTPNLPVRWEIENTGTATGTPTLSAICCSVMIEGGREQTGTTRSANRSITPGVSVGANLVPIISVRLKSAFNRATVIPKKISLLASTTKANMLWVLVMNPTIGAGVAASWTSITSSFCEYDIAQTGTASAGIVLDSGYMSDTISGSAIDIQSSLILASDFAGTSDIVTLCAQKIGGGSDTVFGALTWLEAL